MRYRLLFLVGVFLLPSFLSGCSNRPEQSTSPVAETQSSTTQLSGAFRLTNPDGSKGILSTATGEVMIESLVVDLSELDGQDVTVTGKYSGDTLFVSQVE